MPGCERCWGDAYTSSQLRGTSQVDVYRALVNERDCTPEEQCGDAHIVIPWMDGSWHCICGWKSEEAP